VRCCTARTPVDGKSTTINRLQTQRDCQLKQPGLRQDADASSRNERWEVDRARTRQTACLNCLWRTRSQVEGIWQDEKQAEGSRVRTFNLLSPNRATAQTVYGTVVVRACGSIREASRSFATYRHVRMTLIAELRLAAAVVLVICPHAAKRARSLTLPAMEERAGHRLRQHQQSHEHANSHRETSHQERLPRLSPGIKLRRLSISVQLNPSLEPELVN